MTKGLTEQYELIKRFNPLAAEVYKDKKSYLSYGDIAQYRGIKASEAKELLQQAKLIIKDPEHAWLLPFSNRTKKALILNGYESYKQLYTDVMQESIDLEQLKKIGHQVAVEIHNWCAKHPTEQLQ